MNFNVNFNILKQFNCALVGLIKDLFKCMLENCAVRVLQLARTVKKFQVL